VPSLYDQPQRYLELSPNLHFKGLATAMMFQTGVEPTAIFTLGMWKAAKHFGIPSEYIIYPKSGHMITIPSLIREGAQTNLDWFLFWLRGEEDAVPAKIAQYQRWREMRNRLQQSSADVQSDSVDLGR
jgi:hypothetical protein